MSISYWLDQSSPTAEKNFDVVVIGGGIAGLSATYWLERKDPNLKVAVIEKQRIGFGASGRNAGFVTCGSTEHFIKLNDQFGTEKAIEIWKFSEKNRDLLVEHIIQDQGEALDFRITGSCTVAPSEEHWQKYQKSAQLMRDHGLDVSEVGPDEMKKDFGVSGFVGGIQFNGDGYIHPMKLLHRLRSKLKATIFEGTEVFSVEEQTIKTDKGVIKAGKTLVAMNAYLPLLFKEYAKHITPGRGQILVTEPLPAFVKGPCYLTKHLCYFRQLPTGHLLIGGFRNLAVQDENTYADATTPVIQDALSRFVREHFKYGKDMKVAYQWSGIMGFSPDGQMMIGAHPQNKNLHLMAGCSGHGMGLSFHAAKVLVGSLFGEKIPSHLDLARFSSTL